MIGFNYSADDAIASAQGQLTQAATNATEARDWCLRANTANWDSPAAAIFSRWLAELALGAHRSANQATDARATAQYL